MKQKYAILCVLGVVVPYIFFIQFLIVEGFNLRLFVNQMFANPIASFFAADVIVSTVVLWTFVFQEKRERRPRLWWLCILASLTVGVSLGLPLLLFLREAGKARDSQGATVQREHSLK